jgi:hypothetical protein
MFGKKSRHCSVRVPVGERDACPRLSGAPAAARRLTSDAARHAPGGCPTAAWTAEQCAEIGEERVRALMAWVERPEVRRLLLERESDN